MSTKKNNEKSNCLLVFDEIAVFVACCMVILLVKIIVPGFELDGLDIVMGFCFEINTAIVLAFMVALVTNKSISTKRGPLKRVAREDLLVVIVNSLIMALQGMADGLIDGCGLAITIATLSGNLVRIWRLLRDVIEVI